MASSVLGCVSPITIPNIRTTQSAIQPHIQKLLITNCRSKRGIRPPSQEFHSSWITRKKAGRSHNYWFSSAILAASSPNYFGTMMSSDVVSNDDAHSPSSRTLPSRISPWLMLPPAFENDNMVYKFYSLKDDKVLSINKGDPSGAEARDDEQPSDDSELVGSSHGWLVLYNRRKRDLFLSNPLSRRHIKLPPIHNLPRIPKRGYVRVGRVILSSSPDDQDCRALMIYGPKQRLAFCCPGHGSTTQWTHISTHYGSPVDSCVYSTTQNLFFCENDTFAFEVLDLCDPSSPKCFPMDDEADCELSCPAFSHEDWVLKRLCENLTFLVVAEPEPEPEPEPNSSADQLLLVTRHTVMEMYPDGSIPMRQMFDDFPYDAFDITPYPYKTFDFTVHKYDPNEKTFEYMDGSLDGLAIFVGKNHSFAMRASDFPELKPDSIYFTDVPDLIRFATEASNFGGHDIGIYNYKDKALSPCYYPCDLQSIKRIEPAPMWFTPNPL